MTRHQLVGTIALMSTLAIISGVHYYLSNRAAVPDPSWQVAIENYTPSPIDSIAAADSVMRAAGLADTAVHKKQRHRATKKSQKSPAAKDKNAFNDILRQE